MEQASKTFQIKSNGCRDALQHMPTKHTNNYGKQSAQTRGHLALGTSSRAYVVAALVHI